eukprot:779828-Pyramimonas_sp.AAC.1
MKGIYPSGTKRVPSRALSRLPLRFVKLRRRIVTQDAERMPTIGGAPMVTGVGPDTGMRRP